MGSGRRARVLLGPEVGWLVPGAEQRGGFLEGGHLG